MGARLASPLLFTLALVPACSEPAAVELAPPTTSTPTACTGHACGEGCSPCASDDATCKRSATEAAFCDAAGTCRTGGFPTCTVTATIGGWDAPPASGPVFIVNQIAIGGRRTGFDVDGACTDTSCVDNALATLGELANDQIRQGLLGGESMLLVELAGLDADYDGDDPAVTVDLYTARDADDPFFPANNFKIPPGHDTCCEFLINAEALSSSPPTAKWRIASAIEREQLHARALGSIPFPLIIAERAFLMIERANIAIHVPRGLGELSRGLMGGAISATTLASVASPYCKTVSPRCTGPIDSTMLDLVRIGSGEPDVDLDGDGLERLEDLDGDGRIDRCLDGCLGACAAPEVVAPIDPADPASCVRSPRIADGYSIALAFTAVPAHVVGVATSTTTH